MNLYTDISTKKYTSNKARQIKFYVKLLLPSNFGEKIHNSYFFSDNKPKKPLRAIRAIYNKYDLNNKLLRFR